MSASDIVFVGDVHLDRDDPDLDAFLAFLDRIGETSRSIVLMGDLFNLWIGREGLEQPHQTAVVDRLIALRRKGVSVHYVEGNRDYRIGPYYAGRAFDDAGDEGIELTAGGKRYWAVHGDTVNAADRQYRAWRRFSRSPVFWRLFNLLPRARRLRLAESLETRMRSSNREFKSEFPEDAIRAYAEPMLRGAFDAVVLGHFHVERDITAGPADRPGRILVLPLWKERRRYLRVREDGRAEFTDAWTDGSALR